ncbi:MAG: twin transmembrane helix small protein [Sphingomonadaceae bacterium]
MQTILAILLILAMAATLFALVKGIVQFLRTSHEDLTGDGPNMSGRKQNQAMRMRIFFQGIAVLIVVLILLLAGSER